MFMMYLWTSLQLILNILRPHVQTCAHSGQSGPKITRLYRFLLKNTIVCLHHIPWLMIKNLPEIARSIIACVVMIWNLHIYHTVTMVGLYVVQHPDHPCGCIKLHCILQVAYFRASWNRIFNHAFLSDCWCYVSRAKSPVPSAGTEDSFCSILTFRIQ